MTSSKNSSTVWGKSKTAGAGSQANRSLDAFPMSGYPTVCILSVNNKLHVHPERGFLKVDHPNP